MTEGRTPATLERARKAATLLDDCFVIPGTNIRVGWDAIIGLFPGGGDFIMALAAFYIVLEALRAGAPGSVLARMILNIALDALIGTLPFVGDAFDVFWKPNRRNARLLERYLERPAAVQRRSTAWIALTLSAVLASALAILAMIVFIFGALLRWLASML